MGKKAILTFFFLMILASNNYAVDLNLGLFYGQRTVNDSEIRHTYGYGYIYFPYLSVNFSKSIIFGLGYEGGYSKKGEIGIYQEPARLKVAGPEAFVCYQLRVKSFFPYLKIGCGYFAYKQTVESPYVEEYKVDHKKATVTLSGGFKIFILNNFFLGAEVKYVPFKVQPYEYRVDLGGIRYLVGLGFRFELK
ncbi:MAG: hypothetical protein ACE5GI_03020 [Candidatus Aminicenantales bacterium]